MNDEANPALPRPGASNIVLIGMTRKRRAIGQVRRYRSPQLHVVCMMSLFAFMLDGCGSGGTNSNANGGSHSNADIIVAGNPPNSNSESPSGTVRITSPDGVVLVGTYLEAPKPNSPAVLLLHQWQSDRHSYDEFANRMQSRGFNVLSIDGRGFGESVKTTDGKSVAAERTDAAVHGMLGDVGAALDFLTEQRNVDTSKIGIVGASYGSSLAVIYAAENPKVAATVVISPGLNYFGNMQTEPAIRKYGDRPMFLVAAEDDRESADAVNKLMGAGNNVRYGGKIFPSGGHGTALFKYRDTFDGPPVLAETLEWFLTDRLAKSYGNE